MNWTFKISSTAAVNLKKVLIFFLFLASVYPKADRGYDNDKTNKLPNTVFVEERDPRRKKLVETARSLIGLNTSTITVQGRTYPNDCSGILRGIYSVIGIDIFEKSKEYTPGMNGVKILYHTYKANQWKTNTRSPRPGDWIIFNNTYDQNKNGKWDDFCTHISMVTGVEPDGTIAFIHHVSRGIQRYRMNLRHRKTYELKGKRMNDFLRFRPGNDSDRIKYMSDNLFFCFINILKD